MKAGGLKHTYTSQHDPGLHPMNTINAGMLNVKKEPKRLKGPIETTGTPVHSFLFGSVPSTYKGADTETFSVQGVSGTATEQRKVQFL